MKRRKVCVITGTRAEFGLLKPVMNKIQESDSLELQVIVTGMHLLPEYGKTVSEISRNGFAIDACVPMTVAGDDNTSLSLSIGLGIISFTPILKKLDPDIVLILGDRFEIFSAAVAASFSGYLVAHLSGGDSLQAGYDEYIRHAITKISHIHFPSTKQSAMRIIKMGEDPKNVFVVGSTALDTIVNEKLPSKQELFEKYDLSSDQDFVIVIQHPISTEPDFADQQMKITLDSILDLGLNMLVIYPNNDPGGMKIINVIDQYSQNFAGRIIVRKSIPFEDYLGLLKFASVMIGNSSSGIIESSSFHLPVVNIGDRQKGRERSTNVIDTPHDKQKIKQAINHTLKNEKFKKSLLTCTNPYGDGNASQRIVDILSQLSITQDIFKKKITY
jgi:UDP-N-acetylglucosamine 2-epimerase (non-hydrolysing)/GDP/UDP-N,N'-diacetylbacillosamine 2-epimerase (hydrolysing)